MRQRSIKPASDDRAIPGADAVQEAGLDGVAEGVFDPPLDPGIERYVVLLNEAGVETFESCEGGHGHAFPEPTVRFHGDRAEGLRALAAALDVQLPVQELRRVWVIQDGEPTGPKWEMTFRST